MQQPKPNAAGSPGKDSNKPAQDSTDRLGKAEDGRPDPELIKGMMKDTWGHLPPQAREQMLQNSPERFLPQYELDDRTLLQATGRRAELAKMSSLES